MTRPASSPTSHIGSEPPLKLFIGDDAIDCSSVDATDLQQLLTAWNSTAAFLEATHQDLQAEVSQLTAALEEKNRELAREHRLADLGRMASHIAHEVKNCLVPVTLYLNLLRRRMAGDLSGLEVLTHVEAGLHALDSTVGDLLNFTSSRQPQCSACRVKSIVDEVIGSVRPQLSAQGIEVALDVSPTKILTADRELLRRCVLNLVLNAIDAMPSGGEITVTDCETCRGYELEIADSGDGLVEADTPKLFEPFFSRKAGGTGLGLTVVLDAMQAHGGTARATNCPEGGAAFTLCFPMEWKQEAA